MLDLSQSGHVRLLPAARRAASTSLDSRRAKMAWEAENKLVSDLFHPTARVGLAAGHDPKEFLANQRAEVAGKEIGRDRLVVVAPRRKGQSAVRKIQDLAGVQRPCGISICPGKMRRFSQASARVPAG